MCKRRAKMAHVGFPYLFTSRFSGRKLKLSNAFANFGWVEQLGLCWLWWHQPDLDGGSGPGGSGPKPPDVNELGQWSGQWRPPEPALVAATRARTMRRRRRRIRGLPDSLRQQLRPRPPLSSSLLHLLVLLSLRPPVCSALHRRGFSSPSRGAAAGCCWFKPPQSVLGRGEAHMP